jgi:hypothetical protein
MVRSITSKLGSSPRQPGWGTVPFMQTVKKKILAASINHCQLIPYSNGNNSDASLEVITSPIDSSIPESSHERLPGKFKMNETTSCRIRTESISVFLSNEFYCFDSRKSGRGFISRSFLIWQCSCLAIGRQKYLDRDNLSHTSENDASAVGGHTSIFHKTHQALLVTNLKIRNRKKSRMLRLVRAHWWGIERQVQTMVIEHNPEEEFFEVRQYWFHGPLSHPNSDFWVF